MNLYAYVGNDPLNRTDPSGNAKQALDGLQTALNTFTPGSEALKNSYANYQAGNLGNSALWALQGGLDIVAAAATGGESQALTRVGRWMSQTEFDAMKLSNKVQESLSGTTHAANPADATAFINQAKPGSLYIEFNVPTSSLKATNEGWAKIIGPNSLEGRLAARKDLPIPQMPEATDIVHSATKLP